MSPIVASQSPSLQTVSTVLRVDFSRAAHPDHPSRPKRFDAAGEAAGSFDIAWSAEDLDLTGIFSNYGPINTRFESAFGGGGRGAGGTWVALPRWPCPGRPRGVGAITENLIGVPAVHLLAASGGRTSSINRSFARLNGLTNLTLCKMNPSCKSSVSRHRTPARCAEAHSIASQNANR